MRLLIVEDDKSVAALMRRVLSEDGYAIDVANSGEDGRMLGFVNQYDGIVLDLELGDRHGFELLQELRGAGKNTPVLLYTGQDDSEAIVRGLDAGADDYVVKPISNDELRARVRSLMRRGPASRATEQIVVGNLKLNRLKRRVRIGNRELELTPTELRLLEHLMLHSGQLVTRSELHEKVWDMHFDPSSNLVDAHVARLRKKLTSGGEVVSLVTRRGVGFILEAQGEAEPNKSHQEE